VDYNNIFARMADGHTVLFIILLFDTLKLGAKYSLRIYETENETEGFRKSETNAKNKKPPSYGFPLMKLNMFLVQ
jgi:hypothetical protein